MSAIAISQRYFDAWNRHDAAAIVATFAPDGVYSDPKSGGPLTGDAIGAYAEGLWAAFPDLSFELISAGEPGEDMVSAEWRMRGTNTAPFMGLPPTGRTVSLDGADFIRTSKGKIRSVTGYFDSRGIPDQLGLQVVVQPNAIGPFRFGVANCAVTGRPQAPGAFSITVLEVRSEEEANRVRQHSQQVVGDMMSMKGFIGMLGATVGNRMITVGAWDDAEAPRQLMQGGAHGAAMQDFFKADLGTGGFTSVWTPHRIGTNWVRCPSCAKKADPAQSPVCVCGAQLPEPPRYWL